MALIPILKLVSVADPAASFTVSDGTDFTVIPKSSITAVLLQVEGYNNLGTSIPKLISDTTDLFTAAGMKVLSTDFPSLSSNGAFEDGVYDIKYDLGVNGATTLAVDATDSTKFTYTGADTAFDGAVGFIIPSYKTDKVFYLSTSKAPTSTNGYTTEALPTGLGAVAIQIIYEGDLKVLISAAGNACLLSDIAAWGDKDCENVEFRDIWKRYRQKIAMETKFTKELYNDAHNLAVNLANYCDQSNSCSCS